jgi:hypothetical protein
LAAYRKYVKPSPVVIMRLVDEAEQAKIGFDSIRNAV